MTDTHPETYQQKYIRGLKTSVANILHMLIDNAGKPGKSAIVTGSIKGEVASVEDALGRLKQAVRAEVRTAWTSFTNAWDDGEGSWTKSKEKALAVNRLLQEIN